MQEMSRANVWFCSIIYKKRKGLDHWFIKIIISAILRLISCVSEQFERPSQNLVRDTHNRVKSRAATGRSYRLTPFPKKKKKKKKKN